MLSSSQSASLVIPAYTPDTETVSALVVCRELGLSSEVWIDRQIEGFRAIKPTAVCWGREETHRPSLDGVPTRVLPFPPHPTEGPGRWLVRLRNVPGGNFYGAVGADRRALRRTIRDAEARVILCHFGHIALRVLPAAMDCRVPLVAHFHGLDVSSALRNPWYRRSLLRHLPNFAAIVVVGSHQRRWMIDHGVPEQRIHLIPCGVPTAFFNPPPARETARRLQILAVSRLVPWKGLEESIRALALARERGLDAELHIVGEGSQRTDLEALVGRLHLREHVRFHGPCGPAAIREHFARSDVFVQHSLTHASGWCEGFGVSLAEAAAMGLPVVATRSGGIPDQVLDGETGFLVPERDVPAMASAILRLAHDPLLRARLGAAGRERMVQLFDTRRQIARLESVMLAAAEAAH